MRRDLLAAGLAVLVVTAAMQALHRVFTSAAWLPEAVAAAVLAVAIAALIRRTGLGFPVVVVAEAVGLAMFTLAVHAAGAEAGLAARTLELFGAGVTQFRLQPAPTVPLDGLRLLVTSAVWITAVSTHELLVRWRRPLVALLLPAMLWLVPVAIPQPPGRTWPYTLPLLAAAALVLLVEADGEPTGGTVRERTARLSWAGAVLGAGALAAAGLVPGLVPGYGSPPWLDLSTPTSPRGYQPIVDVGDRLHLPEDRPVLEIAADRRVYLRLAALDTFDGVTWRLGPAGAARFTPASSQLFDATADLPPEVPIGPAEQVQVDVRVLDLENIYVPAPYQVVDVSGPGAQQMIYSRDGGFLATGELEDNRIGGTLRVGVQPGFRYQVTAAVPTPSYRQLSRVSVDPSAAGLARHLQLPGSFPQLTAQARRVYRQASARSPVDKALALQEWFTGPGSPFTYSTDTSQLRGTDALQDFVLEERTGYCEYFASAMAVMLRATGVPARVSVGFLPGTSAGPGSSSGDSRQFTVSTRDAHAWVEVLFPGYGWMRFDPTPRSDGATMRPTSQDLRPTVPDRERQAAAPTPAPTPTTSPTEQDQARQQASAAPAPSPSPSRAQQPQATGGAGSGLPWPLLALIVVLAGAGLAAAARRRRAGTGRGDGPVARVLATQERVLARARRLGVGRHPSETTSEVAARWAAEGRTPPEVAARLARLWQAAAFAGQVSAAEAEDAERLAQRLRGDLASSVSTGDRVLAPVRIPWESAAGTARRVSGRLRRTVTGGPGQRE